ncbi:MAG: DUF1330 domain-containing protein [Rhodospirillales bacterium]|nr:DUF1330 domain-containing protein [Rhodospirillales bacterium]MCW9001368.1 DUF1330 domain-containing protein [Rhodospirillales bacterium]
MKGYWIALVNVTDTDAYAEYAKRSGPAIQKFGGKLLARGGRNVGLEGPTPPGRIVIVEFDSLERAQECFNSPDYQEARSFRVDAAEAQFMIVEGV